MGMGMFCQTKTDFWVVVFLFGSKFVLVGIQSLRVVSGISLEAARRFAWSIELLNGLCAIGYLPDHPNPTRRPEFRVGK
eukprot:3216872-Pyramimonas_sp.AAC.1